MEKNHKQPELEVRSKKIIEVDGLQFKDLNNDGKLDPYEDWRLSPKERAENLVSSVFINETRFSARSFGLRRQSLYGSNFPLLFKSLNFNPSTSIMFLTLTSNSGCWWLFPTLTPPLLDP